MGFAPPGRLLVVTACPPPRYCQKLALRCLVWVDLGGQPPKPPGILRFRAYRQAGQSEALEAVHRMPHGDRKCCISGLLRDTMPSRRCASDKDGASRCPESIRGHSAASTGVMFGLSSDTPACPRRLPTRNSEEAFFNGLVVALALSCSGVRPELLANTEDPRHDSRGRRKHDRRSRDRPQ